MSAVIEQRPASAMGTGPMLIARGVTKQFGGLTAVDSVDLVIERGASVEDIQQAFRRCARWLHPDRFPEVDDAARARPQPSASFGIEQGTCAGLQNVSPLDAGDRGHP